MTIAIEIHIMIPYFFMETITTTSKEYELPETMNCIVPIKVKGFYLIPMMDGCFNRRPFRIEKIEGASDLDVIPLLTVLLFPLTNLPCGSKRGYVQMNNEKTTERYLLSSVKIDLKNHLFHVEGEA